jgi:hypothetical protein
MLNANRHPANIEYPNQKQQKSKRFEKLKEEQAIKRRQRFYITFNSTQKYPPNRQKNVSFQYKCLDILNNCVLLRYKYFISINDNTWRNII